MTRKKIIFNTSKNAGELDNYIVGKHDPLLRAINFLSRNKKVRVWLFAVIFYFLTIFVPGVYISITYKGTEPIVPIYDYRDLPFVIFAYVLVVPIIWVFYSWQIKGFMNTLSTIKKNKVIPEKYWPANYKDEKDIFDKTSGSLISLLIAIVASVIWVWSLTFPNSFNIGGKSWIYVNYPYLISVMVPADMLNIYMVSNILIRQGIMTSLLYKLVNGNRIDLKPFHSDRCNGFAPIGIYILQISAMGILFGFWVSVVFIYPMFYGQPINIKIDTVLLFAVYVIVIPFTVIYSAWGTHKAMAHAKDTTLDLLANQIQKIVMHNDITEIIAEKNVLQELYQRYDLLKRELKTWPFPDVALKNFVFTAFTPLMSALLSYISDKYLHVP